MEEKINTEQNVETKAAPKEEPKKEESVEVKSEAPAAEAAKPPVKPPKFQRNFTLHDVIFAWFSFIAGYLLCQVFPVTQNTLGGMLFVIMLFVFTAVFMKTKGVKLTALPVLAVVSAVVISASLVLSSNAFIHFFAYAYALAAYCYFIYAATGNSLKEGFTPLLVIDWVKAVFLMPMHSFKHLELFRAMFHSRNNKGFKLMIRLVTGIGIAIIPTGFVLLLLSYDNTFTALLDRVFDLERFNIFPHILSLMFAVPIGMYLYSLYISSVDKKLSNTLNEKKYNKLTAQIRIAPVATVLAAVIPLLAVYVLFFVSQWQYYISGFTGVLPENFSYAEYAREGFFQLLAVSVINLAVIMLVILLMKKGKYSSLILKTLSVVFSVFTLVLISTAVAKMVMYIKYYGLTQKRVYATWFMAVLAVIFIVIALSRFFPKISAVAVSAAVLVVSFAGLALCNADSLIAKYNVDRYISGTLDTVDIAAMSNLGDAAVPELVRLAKYMDEKNGTDIKNTEYGEIWYKIDTYNMLVKQIMDEAKEIEAEDNSIFSFTLNGMRAEKALKELELIE